MMQGKSMDKSQKLEIVKKLFYSCQLTKFILEVLKFDDDFFLDGIHLSICLRNLNLIKTKLQL